MIRAVTLVPELGCTNVLKTLDFYTNTLGFSVKYKRVKEGFYSLEREGAIIMIEQLDDNSWLADTAKPPLGRGMHFEIDTINLQELHENCLANNAPIFRKWEEAWYRVGDQYEGQAQFIVRDPDGYLLRFVQDMGQLKSPPKSGRIVG